MAPPAMPRPGNGPHPGEYFDTPVILSFEDSRITPDSLDRWNLSFSKAYPEFKGGIFQVACIIQKERTVARFS